MSKFLSLLAAVAFALVLVRPAHAGITPLTLAFAAESQPPAPPPHLSAKLSLQPPILLLPNPRFIVGSAALGSASASADASLRFAPPDYLRTQARFILNRITTPSLLEQLADLFDIEEVDRPWSTTTTVHLLIAQPARGQLTPFISFAHQIDIDEEFERLGLGAGLLYTLQKNVTLGAEVLYYGSDHPSLDGGCSPEALFLARLQIEF